MRDDRADGIVSLVDGQVPDLDNSGPKGLAVLGCSGVDKQPVTKPPEPDWQKREQGRVHYHVGVAHHGDQLHHSHGDLVIAKLRNALVEVINRAVEILGSHVEEQVGVGALQKGYEALKVSLPLRGGDGEHASRRTGTARRPKLRIALSFCRS